MIEKVMLQTTNKAKVRRLRKNIQEPASLEKEQQTQHDSLNISTTLTQEQLVKMMQIVEEIRLNGYK
ncbi:hypothetical protein ACIQ1H_05555 [Lysinibacillus sp. NPDC097279]|uniref:hypothetical protein n=1 Tax=unclassified Lysinibacillus TaxID=2636778 RepID=UPI00116B7E2A|nr:hypothetical protein [Lysinibacillus sp. CD3-6]UED78310.1 hypothetical protein FH508_0012610 [Lysinibacillus sp. CD3-6]